MFGVQLSYLGTSIGLFWQNTCILKKIFTFPFFSLFSNAQSDSFRGVGSQLTTHAWSSSLLEGGKLHLHAGTIYSLTDVAPLHYKRLKFKSFWFFRVAVRCMTKLLITILVKYACWLYQLACKQCKLRFRIGQMTTSVHSCLGRPH
jgi:hypothetical protein